MIEAKLLPFIMIILERFQSFTLVLISFTSRLSFLLFVLFALLSLYTITLTALTTFCSWRKGPYDNKDNMSMLHTAMYKGRVSHSRSLPIRHSFSYPFFIFAIDLDEADTLFGKSLWPMNRIIAFCEQDHLKNGEGSQKMDEYSAQNSKESLKYRVLRLVQQRTNGKCNLLMENSEGIQVILLTHLKYFGYCFNPVSFYYIFRNETNESHNSLRPAPRILEAIVAEVSNTPWNEMYCYVLHPDSVDVLHCKEGIGKKLHDGNIWKSFNFRFNKVFHVSPFMEMDHLYDWTFWIPDNNQIAVSNTLLKKKKRMQDHEKLNNSKEGSIDYCTSEERFETDSYDLYFNAYMHVHRTPFHPMHILWEMLRFPVYCMIIQIWIHWEALLLFIKGVEFVPHPNEAETTASRIIGAIMTPIFAIKHFFSVTDNCKKKEE